MAEAFEIAGQTIEPGTRRAIDLRLPRLYTHSELTMPIFVIRGRHEGPRLLLCAAIHGDELNGLEIVRQVMRRVDEKKLHGALVCVPVVNVFGMIAQSRYLPDRRDLNRSFPGAAGGSLAARVAHLFLDHVVRKCTHGIDLHTAAQSRTNLPQIRGNFADAETRRLAKVFNTPVMVHAAVRDGSLREAAGKLGIKLLVFEGGEPLHFNDGAIDAGVHGVLRVMAALGMRRGPKLKSGKPPTEVRSSAWVRARTSGILRLTIGLGDRVVKGQKLGEISDPLDVVLRIVEAPNDGIIIGHAVNPLVHRGDAVANLGAFDGHD